MRSVLLTKKKAKTMECKELVEKIYDTKSLSEFRQLRRKLKTKQSEMRLLERVIREYDNLPSGSPQTVVPHDVT